MVLWSGQLLLAVLLVLAWLLIALICCWAPLVLLRAAGRALEPRILSVDEIFDEKAPDARSASADQPQP